MFEKLAELYKYDEEELEIVFLLLKKDYKELEAMCQITQYLELDSVLDGFRRFEELQEIAKMTKSKPKAFKYRCAYCGTIHTMDERCTCDGWREAEAAMEMMRRPKTEELQ